MRMVILRHALIALTYTAIAIALAVTLPYGFPDIAPGDALIIGGLFLVTAALLHEVLARFERDAVTTAQLVAMEAFRDEMAEEVHRARQEVRHVHALVEETQGKSPQKIGDIVAEVRVLQKLVEQFSGKHATALDREAAKPAEKPFPRPGETATPIRMSPDAVLALVEDALRRDRIDLFLQPVVSLPQRQSKFYEAFSRIRADDGSFLTPDLYLKIAEQEGLITPIDNLLLFRCVQIVRSQRNKARFGFFVNISKHTLADRAFFREFIDFMEANAELAPHLIFEFAQADLPLQRPEIASELQRLAKLGFRFGIDQVTKLDFDLDMLHARRFKFVKIDIETLLAEKREKGHPNAIKAIRDSFFRNGIDLIVEKIEDEATLIDLLEDSIDYGQGYLFGEPKLRR